jgi:hypothetical protein
MVFAALIFATFVFVSPVHAANPTVIANVSCVVSAGFTSCTTATGLSIIAGDFVVVATLTAAGNYGCAGADISAVTTTPTDGATFASGGHLAGTTDNLNVWYSSSLMQVTQSETFTVTLTASPPAGNACLAMITQYRNTGVLTVNLQTPVSQFSVGCGTCTIPAVTMQAAMSYGVISTPAIIFADLEIDQSGTPQSWTFGITANSGFGGQTALSGCGNFNGICLATWPSNAAATTTGTVTITVTTIAAAGSCTTNCNNFQGVVVLFYPRQIPINTDCIGAVSGSYANSGSWLASKYLYWYQGQAIGTVAEILYNFTTYVQAVHITTTTATLYLVLYVGNTNIPSASNPMSLVWNTGVVLNNNTTPQYLHASVSAPIQSGVYYAVGLFAASSASRYSGNAQSGTSGIEIANPSLTVFANLYNTNVGASTLPATVYGSTIAGGLFLLGCSKFGIVVITTTVISTFTGTVFTTMTTAVTTYNLQGSANTLTGFAISLVVILTPTVLLAVMLGGVTKSGAGAIIGGLVGLTVGTGLGFYAGIVPLGWVYLAVISIIAMILFAVMALRGSGV